MSYEHKKTGRGIIVADLWNRIPALVQWNLEALPLYRVFTF
jgi:hypothetical protein